MNDFYCTNQKHELRALTVKVGLNRRKDIIKYSPVSRLAAK